MTSASKESKTPVEDGCIDPHKCGHYMMVHKVVFPGPVEFMMGSPPTEKDHLNNELLYKHRIGRSFAIASKSVTLGEYRSLTKTQYSMSLGAKYERDLDNPVLVMSWYMAAKYCNLLSEAEGIEEEQWCYKTDAKGEVVSLKANYLSLSGYRLPTEGEMEYATRAGALTSRYYGETDELLGRYAWYVKNADDMPWPVGRKKPNDFGLFEALPERACPRAHPTKANSAS